MAKEFGDAVLRPGRHLGVQFDLGVMAGVAHHRLHRVQHARPLHRSQVDGRTVVDPLGGPDGAFDDVADVGPVADLTTCSPHDEGVLLDEGPRDHGDHGVVLLATLAVDREVAARRGVETALACVVLKRHLAHELGPAIHVVGVVRWTGHIFREVESLVRVFAAEVRVDAAEDA
jgi:hypothetical protein